MKLVSPLLKRVVYPGLAHTGYLRRRAESGPAVVTYHGVWPAGYRGIDASLDGGLVRVPALRAQIRLLQKNYNLISAQLFRAWCEGREKLPDHAVLLTCDDGLANTLTDMLAVLQECGASCLFFVTGSSADSYSSLLWYEELYLMMLEAPARFSVELPEFALRVSVSSAREKRNQWGELVRKMSSYDRTGRRGILEQIRGRLGLREDWNTRYLGDVPGKRRFLLLTPSQLRELAEEMEVGAHSLSHPMLSQMPEDAAREEIAQSRRQLEQVLGKPVWALAYPFGDSASVTSRELRLAEEAGYGCAFMNVGGGFGAEFPRFAIPRVHVTADMSLAEFEAHVSGFYRFLRRRFAGEGNSLPLAESA